LKTERGIEVTLAIRNETKRPDFTLVEVGQRLRVVEIKASGHAFDDNDCERLLNYIDAFDQFFAEHSSVREEFPSGYQIDLIADGLNLKKPANKQAFAAALEKSKVVRSKWIDFLNRAKKSHEAFLRISNRVTKPAVAKRSE
ncbi:MAG TPA: hypothetical protein VJ865_12250, partial [Gemmatimonadaceae bacterium]|nr:hypothetical protein [Gemmatimonadaceae bacterium]